MSKVDTGRASEALMRESEPGASGSFFDWAAILAGSFVAFAVSAIFLKFGIALGLAIAPLPGGTVRWGMPDAAVVVVMGLWVIFTQLSGFVAGGYVAGRMRRPSGEIALDETRVRDGMNGVGVWAVGSTLMLAMTAWLAISGLSASASALGGVASSPVTAYVVDTLLRPQEGPAMAGEAAPSAPDVTGPATTGGPDTSAVIGRILERASDFTLDESDKSYIARLVAQRTGLSDQEARTRVDEVTTRFRDEAERARQYSVISAFVAAVAALVGAIAAWSAATWGGTHRDGATAQQLAEARAW